jgi:DNA-binding MarR family transcriptional regulator
MKTSRLAFELYAVSARLLRVLGNHERTGSLTHQRIGTLLALADSGSLSVKEIAQRQVVAHSTMSRLVAALAAAGLITRSGETGRSPDKRMRTVRLTAKGKRTVERELRQATALLEERIAALADGERAALSRAIEILRNLASSIPVPPVA